MELKFGSRECKDINCTVYLCSSHSTKTCWKHNFGKKVGRVASLNLPLNPLHYSEQVSARSVAAAAGSARICIFYIPGKN